MHCRATSPRKPHGQGFVAQLPLRLTAATPKPYYPKQFKHLGDHLKARRVDLGLEQRAVAARIGTTVESLRNWECGVRQAEERIIPGIIRFLGYNPLPEATTFGESVRRARLSRGWTLRCLAQIADVDPATAARLEVDAGRLSRRPVMALLIALGLSESSLPRVGPRTESPGGNNG